MRTTILFLALLLMAAPTYAVSNDFEAAPARLAIAFGVADGQLLQVGDYLVFADSSEPLRSFAIPRSDVSELKASADMVTLVTRVPVGDRTTFTFRMTDAATAARFAGWARTSRAAAVNQDSEVAFTRTYVVRQKRRMGSDSEGRLVFSGDRVSYESITDIDKSRSWTLSEIKELKRKNPYRVEISPFVGDSYTFDLVGTGLASDDYKHLADRITQLRLR